MKIALILITAPLLAQSPAPPKPDPAKTVEQQIADLKAENENLKKLLAAYDREYNACHAAVLQLQVLGPKK